jgi:hypothetical protein
MTRVVRDFVRQVTHGSAEGTASSFRLASTIERK